MVNNNLKAKREELLKKRNQYATLAVVGGVYTGAGLLTVIDKDPLNLTLITLVAASAIYSGQKCFKLYREHRNSPQDSNSELGIQKKYSRK